MVNKENLGKWVYKIENLYEIVAKEGTIVTEKRKAAAKAYLVENGQRFAIRS